MKFFTTKDQTEIFYKDVGDGAPVILIHGWPLSADMWEDQSLALVEAGFRVIAYDRRGFGRSEQPNQGYNYNTFASDLDDLFTHLELKKAALVGFSMGGGEVARYLKRYGTDLVSSATLISSITPIMMKSSNNPAGVPEGKIMEISASIRKDRFAFFHNFFKDFYGLGLMSHPYCNRWPGALIFS